MLANGDGGGDGDGGNDGSDGGSDDIPGGAEMLTFKTDKTEYNVGENIESAWDKEKEPNQWKRLIQLIEERNPDKIGLNYSKDHNIADGLDKTDYDEFMKNLPKKLHKKVVSAERLAVGWIG